MELKRLRYFLAVVDERNFARAAAKLLMTPPPLSRQIRLLEEELGGPLFERNYHDVRLTPLGEKLVAPARELIARADALLRLAEDEMAGPAWRIAASAHMPIGFIDQFTEAVRALEPAAADAVALATSSPAAGGLVLSGKADIALVNLPVPDEALDVRGWGRYRMAVAMRYDDPLARRESLTLADLADRSVIQAMQYVHPRAINKQIEILKRHVGELIVLPGIYSGSELPTHVWTRGFLTLTPERSDPMSGGAFSSPGFVRVPLLDGDSLAVDIGVVWSRERAKRDAKLRAAVDAIFLARAGAPVAAADVVSGHLT